MAKLALASATLLLAVLAWAALPAAVAAESPSPSPVMGGDTRSAGEGPGFVGSPGLAIGAVAAIGVVTLLGTLAYVRLTGGPGRDPR